MPPSSGRVLSSESFRNYPLDRPVPAGPWGWDRLPECAPLRQAWEQTALRLQDLRFRLAHVGLPPAVRTVVAVGSLGRMEWGPGSDADLLTLVDDPHADQRDVARPWIEQVLRELGLPPPEPTGIYAQPVRMAALLDPETRGQVQEPLAAFGARMNCLLEGQPVYGEAAFRELQRGIVARYASEFVARAPHKMWTYLLNDLVRYFRTLCLTYQWQKLDRPGSWRLRNLKARFSRRVMYVGFVSLLGEASRQPAPAISAPGVPAAANARIDWLADRLTLTPLERLATVYSAHADAGFETLRHAYGRFVAAAADPVWRIALESGSSLDAPESGLPAEPGRVLLPREANPAYLALKAHAETLGAELVRFLLARRDTWSTRFFERLLL